MPESPNSQTNHKTPVAVTLAVVFSILVAAGARIPLMAEPGMQSDMTWFVKWAAISKRDGLSAVYEPQQNGRPNCNYPPGYVFVLRGLASVYDLVSPVGQSLDRTVVQSIYDGKRTSATRRANVIFKAPAVASDIALAGMLAFIVGRRWRARSAWAIGLLYALAPAAIHNCALWGQVDSILAMLLVIAFWLAHQKKMIAMSVVAFIAFLTKAQAAMVAPVFAYLLIDWARSDWTRWRNAGLAIVITIGVFLLPFLSKLNAVSAAYTGAASYYPFVHLNGFSAWYLTSPIGEPHLDAFDLSKWYLKDNASSLFGLSPRTIGFVSLLIIWAGVIWAIVRKKGDSCLRDYAIRIFSLGFFVVSTQMHERYLFPAIALWAFAYQPRWRWWLGWIVIVAAESINQMWVWAGPPDAPPGYAISDVLREVRLGGLTIGSMVSLALATVLVIEIASFIRAVKEKTRSSVTTAHST